MQKITKTFVRTEETMKKYFEFSEENKKNNIVSDPFVHWQDSLVKEFKHWVIIQNRFPYDAIATVSHMIAPKRKVKYDWKLLSLEEEKELEELQNTYINEHYDVIWENLPKGRTIPGHFHLHLLVLKRVELEI